MSCGHRLRRKVFTLGAWFGRHRKFALSVGGTLLVVLAVGLGVAFGLGVATLVVVVYGTTFSAILVIGWTPLQALPALEVGLWHAGELTVTFKREADLRAPIDIGACVRNAVAAVRSEVPPPPRSESTPGMLGLTGLSQFAYQSPLAGKESREDAIERLNKELAAYEAALRQWLEGYASRRWASYSIIRAHVAIHNWGEYSADGITLRIVLPDRIVPMTSERLDMLKMSPPPEPPRYEERSLLDIPSLHMPRVAQDFPAWTSPTARARTAAAGPTYVMEHGRSVAEVRLDTLTHGVTERSVDPLVVLPREAGVYELPWEAHVGNLRKPVRGTITIEVGSLTEAGSPLTRVEAVRQTNDVSITRE